MTHFDWNAALLDAPDDDLARLAFADWLEERGEASRAAWVRLSVGLPAHRREIHAEWWRLHDEHRAAFARCWPGAWADVPNVTREPDRGLVGLVVRTKTALAKLGGCPWLPAAHAAGWLGPVNLGLLDEDVTAALAAASRRRLAGLPLAATAGASARAVSRHWAFAHPDLYELRLDVWGAAPDLPARLAACPRLRIVHVAGNAAHPEVGAAVVAAGAAPGLRRLTVSDWRSDVTGGAADESLLALAGHPKLRRLVVRGCPVLTQAGLAAFSAAAPHVAVEWAP